MSTAGDPMVPATDRPRTRPEVEAVDVDGELVLWDPTRERVHRLDRVASLLWPFLDGSATIAELAADVADVWGTPEPDALDALRALVAQLRDARLLVDDGPAPPPYLADPPAQ